MSNKKYKIGYTTGVFDMFHIGHLNILKRAKSMCECLIVGISTDKLVQKYKNKAPIIPYSERYKIIEAIKYVDKVVPQINRDKISAFKKIHFDVMFVGDDWRGTKLFDAVEKKLNNHGTKIEYFPYTKNISSTKLKKILEKISKENYY